MHIAVLGTGAVGQAMSGKFLELGHQVFMGTRDVEQSLTRTDTDNWGTPGVGKWVQENPQVHLVGFREAVEKGTDLITFAMNGMAALDALGKIPMNLLQGKIMIDQSNPLDFSVGFPPVLSVCNTDSLGERIQNTYPGLRVVKTLNSVSHSVMTHPEVLEGDHVIFICGNDLEAKGTVVSLLKDFGWKARNIIDLGGIEAARGTEMLLPLWLRLMALFQTTKFNLNIIRSADDPT